MRLLATQIWGLVSVGVSGGRRCRGEGSKCRGTYLAGVFAGCEDDLFCGGFDVYVWEDDAGVVATPVMRWSMILFKQCSVKYHRRTTQGWLFSQSWRKLPVSSSLSVLIQ